MYIRTHTYIYTYLYIHLHTYHLQIKQENHEENAGFVFKG